MRPKVGALDEDTSEHAKSRPKKPVASYILDIAEPRAGPDLDEITDAWPLLSRTVLVGRQRLGA
jgi:hypothetical protein